MKQHVLQGYLQCCTWLCTFTKDISIDPLRYGYRLNEDDLVSLVLTDTLILADFPSPCNC